MRRIFPPVFLFVSGLLVAGHAQRPPIPVLDHGGRIIITRLDSLNSAYRETNLSITPDGRYLFFQSQRGGMPWSSGGFGAFRGQARYDGDIWYSRRADDGVWRAPQCLDQRVNTSRGEDEPVVAADGQSIIFQSWKNGWERSGGPYYRAELRGADWQQPTGLGGGINRYFVEEFYKYSGYATDGVAVSVDGNTFLVACGPDYEGDLEVLISRRRDGQWSYPQRAAISTARDERSLFIAGDNRTLFFASDGYGGFGGLDIFKTTLDDEGRFGPVVNIGKPFNTPQDDYGFIVNAAGTEAYFVRDGDIYFADLRGADPGIRPLPTLLVNGTVRDPEGLPLEAEVRVVRRPSLEVVALARSNALTGEYALAIPKRPGDYELVFLAPGFPELRRPLPVDDPGAFEQRTIDPSLRPAPEPEPVTPPPAEAPSIDPVVVQFDFDRSDIKPEFTARLDTLCTRLLAHPAARISIDGHTDSRGADAYNIALGRRRSESVRAYLLARGVTNPITTDTHGEREPVAGNDSDAGRYRNRRATVRVEF